MIRNFKESDIHDIETVYEKSNNALALKVTSGFFKKDKKDYSLTSNGYLLATNVIKLIDNWYSIEKNKIFWTTKSY